MAGFEEVLIGKVLAQAAKPVVESVKHGLARRGYGRTDVYTAVNQLLGNDNNVPTTFGQVWNLPVGFTQKDVEAALRSPEGHAIIRLLISVHLEAAGGMNERIERQTAKSVIALLKAHTNKRYELQTQRGTPPRLNWERLDFNQLETYANKLCTSLSGSCKNLAQQLIKSLSHPGEALTWAYQNLALYHLGEIDSYLDRICKSTLPPEAEFDEWFASYKKSFMAGHSMIQVPDLLERKIVPYTHLFVPGTFSPFGASSAKLVSQDFGTQIGLEQLTTRMKMTVILGDPGAGKSTTSTVLALQEMTRGQHVPFIVTLKNIDIGRSGVNIIAAIEKILSEKYQTPAPPDQVKRLLFEGRAFIIFDGLDELLDGSTKQTTVETVEKLAELYPLSKFLVTSRRIGYSTCKLSEDIFDEFLIGSFSEEQVKQYVTNWFSVEHNLIADDRDRTVSEFMKLSDPIADLRSNPLMLAFICVLYRGRVTIPHKRPEIFRQCVDLFLQQWDRSRGIWDYNVDLDLVELALAYVAHAIMTYPQLQLGVTEDQVFDIVAEPLLNEGVPDRREVRQVVRELLRLCRGRAWIFTDVALNEHGEDLFLFTHASFMEYFAALHIHRSTPNAIDVANLIIPQISTGKWEILAQICIGLRMRNMVGGGSEIIQRILNEAERIMINARRPWQDWNQLRRDEPTGQEALDRSVDVALVDFLLRVSETLPLSSPTLERMVAISAEHFISGRSTALSTLFGVSYRYLDAVHGKLRAILTSATREFAAAPSKTDTLTTAMAWFAVHLGYVASTSLVSAVDSNLILQTRKNAITAEVLRDLGRAEGALPWNLHLHSGGSLDVVDSQTLTGIFEGYVSPLPDFGPATTSIWLIDCFSAMCRRSLPVADAATLLARLSLVLSNDMFENRFPTNPAVERIQPDALVRASRNLASYRSEVQAGWLVIAMGIMEIWEFTMGLARSELLVETGMKEMFDHIVTNRLVGHKPLGLWMTNSFNVWHQDGPLDA